MGRDYLTTIDNLSKVDNAQFWVEEICYVLDGNRDLQVFQLGNSSEYFKDLIKRSGNNNFQQRLLVEAIQTSLENFPFNEFIYNIEEEQNYKIVITYIGLTRTFCSKNFLIVRLITDFFLKVCIYYLRSKNHTFLQSDPFINIYSNTRYLIEDFVVADLEYEQINKKLFREYDFLIQYFKVIESFLIFGGDLLIDTLLHLNRFKFPLNISTDIAKAIIDDSDLLDSLIIEFKKDQPTYGIVLQKIFLAEIDGKKIIKKLDEFDVPEQEYEKYVNNTNKHLDKLHSELLGSGAFIQNKALSLKSRKN